MGTAPNNVWSDFGQVDRAQYVMQWWQTEMMLRELQAKGFRAQPLRNMPHEHRLCKNTALLPLSLAALLGLHMALDDYYT